MSTFCKAEATEGGRDDLVVTAPRAEEIPEFTILAAEAAGCGMILEVAHASDPSLDAAMVLLEGLFR